MEPLQEDVEYLEHFGVKGMHWGIRRGSKITGTTRRRGALVDRNNREVNRELLSLTGQRRRVSSSINRAFMGKTDWEHALKTNITRLNNQTERLKVKTGKSTIRDKFDIFASVSAGGLLVSYKHDLPKGFKRPKGL